MTGEAPPGRDAAEDCPGAANEGPSRERGGRGCFPPSRREMLSARRLGTSCRLLASRRATCSRWVTWTRCLGRGDVGGPPARDFLACISRAYVLLVVPIREGAGSSRMRRRKLVPRDQITIAPDPPSFAASRQSEAYSPGDWSPTRRTHLGPTNAWDQSNDAWVVGGKLVFKTRGFHCFSGRLSVATLQTPFLALTQVNPLSQWNSQQKKSPRPTRRPRARPKQSQS